MWEGLLSRVGQWGSEGGQEGRHHGLGFMGNCALTARNEVYAVCAGLCQGYSSVIC